MKNCYYNYEMKCGEQYIEGQDFGVVEFKSTYVKNEDGSFDVSKFDWPFVDNYKIRINKLRD